MEAGQGSRCSAIAPAVGFFATGEAWSKVDGVEYAIDARTSVTYIREVSGLR